MSRAIGDIGNISSMILSFGHHTHILIDYPMGQAHRARVPIIGLNNRTTAISYHKDSSYTAKVNSVTMGRIYPFTTGNNNISTYSTHC